MKKLECKEIANEIMEGVKKIPNKKKLCIISVGHDPASAAYMRGKMKDAEKCEIPCQHYQVEDTPDAWSVLEKLIIELNADETVGGEILQLPLPESFPKGADKYFTNMIAKEKDVDGFRSDSPFMPCTPEGILYLLSKQLGDLAGKHILLIGKGKLIGKPLIQILLDLGVTLTVAGSKSNLDELYESWYDAVVVAVGKRRLVDLERLFTDFVVDAGINFDENGKMCGDCFYFNEDPDYDLTVTPVPGGVGLMTRAILMLHMGEVSKCST